MNAGERANDACRNCGRQINPPNINFCSINCGEIFMQRQSQDAARWHEYCDMKHRLDSAITEARDEERKLMACGHPKACWVEVVSIKESLESSLNPDSYCSACMLSAANEKHIRELEEEINLAHDYIDNRVDTYSRTEAEAQKDSGMSPLVFRIHNALKSESAQARKDCAAREMRVAEAVREQCMHDLDAGLALDEIDLAAIIKRVK